jgi:probable HAF family extracellular repeat protein
MKPHRVSETKKNRGLFLTGLVIVACALLVATLPALAAQYFQYFKIVASGASVTQPLDINKAGLVVGVDTVDGGFLLKNGVFTRINIPGTCTAPIGINSQGQIVGYYDANNCAENPQGFIYSGGTFTTINVPGSLLTEPNGINDSGTIVGQYRAQSGNTNNQGFIYSAGAFTSLDFPGAVETGAEKINNSGQVVGYYIDSNNNQHAFIYANGVFQNLFGLVCTNSVAFGINNLGFIVGSCDSKAFLYNYNAHSYTFFSYPGEVPVPFAINDSNRVVGYYAVQFNEYNGFLAVPIQ